jgi:hypothetical protein
LILLLSSVVMAGTTLTDTVVLDLTQSAHLRDVVQYISRVTWRKVAKETGALLLAAACSVDTTAGMAIGPPTTWPITSAYDAGVPSTTAGDRRRSSVRRRQVSNESPTAGSRVLGVSSAPTVRTARWARSTRSVEKNKSRSDLTNTARLASQ